MILKDYSKCTQPAEQDTVNTIIAIRGTILIDRTNDVIRPVVSGTHRSIIISNYC